MTDELRPDGHPGHEPLPGLSVVVPTRDRAARLERLLGLLLADPATAEVVVVDDDSSDETPSVLARLAAADPRVRPLRLQPNAGPATARLRGAQQAARPTLLLLDDDVVPGPGLVTGHARHHARGWRGLVLGYMPTRIDTPGTTFATRQYAEAYESSCRDYERRPAAVLEHLWGGNLSLPREDFLAVAAEPDWRPLRYHEDTDLGLRLQRRGLPAVFDRSLRGEHRYERSWAQFLRDVENTARGQAAMAQAHPTKGVAEPPTYAGSRVFAVLLLLARVPGGLPVLLQVLHAGILGAGALPSAAWERRLASLARSLVLVRARAGAGGLAGGRR